MTLKDKRIVVLGGTSGIGLAVAEAAATDGARVLVASRDEARVKRALTTLPAGAEGHVLDLSNVTAIEAFFDAVGPLDHLVYTAGESLKLSPLAECDIAGAVTSSKWVIGARSWRPDGGTARSGRAARSCSHPALQGQGQDRAGLSRRVSAGRWRG
jgi:NAD(P)-dependent dehydrogenase (short-subunit alcohol dehydrogenase family)